MALMHHPVANKHGEVVHSAVTNLDLHDMARAARTYGVEKFYVVTPLEDQQVLARRIVDHWVTGPGSAYNPKRKQALDLISVQSGFEGAMAHAQGLAGVRPKTVVTGATRQENSMGFGQLSDLLHAGQAVMLIFGTAWGLTQEFMASADIILDPVTGAGDYNHLSVRSAASIILDRLLGR